MGDYLIDKINILKRSEVEYKANFNALKEKVENKDDPENKIEDPLNKIMELTMKILYLTEIGLLPNSDEDLEEKFAFVHKMKKKLFKNKINYSNNLLKSEILKVKILLLTIKIRF